MKNFQAFCDFDNDQLEQIADDLWEEGDAALTQKFTELIEDSDDPTMAVRVFDGGQTVRGIKQAMEANPATKDHFDREPVVVHLFSTERLTTADKLLVRHQLTTSISQILEVSDSVWHAVAFFFLLQLVTDAQARQMSEDFNVLDQLLLTRELLRSADMLDPASEFEHKNEAHTTLSLAIQDHWDKSSHANIYPILRVCRLPQATFDLLIDVCEM